MIYVCWLRKHFGHEREYEKTARAGRGSSVARLAVLKSLFNKSSATRSGGAAGNTRRREALHGFVGELLAKLLAKLGLREALH